MTDQTATQKVIVRRTIRARPDDVFDAWLDPAKMHQWLCGNDPQWRFRLDPRVGGKFSIDMMHEGKSIPHDGEYRIIDRPHKLQFTWNSPYTGDGETVVTVELTPSGDHTDLVLTHEGLPEKQREGHREGWTSFARKLDEWIA